MKRNRLTAHPAKCALALALAAALFAVPAHAGDSVTAEYTVKAALVYNFARFSEWPEGAGGRDSDILRVVYFGDENLKAAFATIDGLTVADRRIQVRYASKPEDAVGCQLLFLAKTERDKWPQITAAITDQPVLTIGEMNGFLENGGIVNLHLADNKKIRFRINLDQAKRRNLQLSSQILRLASSVIETQKADD